MKKTILSLTLALSLMCSASVNCMNVNASTLSGDSVQQTSEVETAVTTYNEYEAYTYYLSLSDSELLNIGFSQDDIDYLRNFDFEEAVRERASLSNDKLNALGYSSDQISALKSTRDSGIIDSRAFATATIYSSLSSASTSRFKVNFSWSWSSCPVFIREDIIACVWNGTNSSGQPLNVAVDKSSLSHTVKYYDTYSGKTTSESKSYSIKNEYSGVSSKFRMGYNYGDGYMRWAKSGSGSVTVKGTGGSIKEVLMKFEYGHTYITGSPSFSIAGSGSSIGISFNATTKTEDYSTHRYSSDGKTLS